MLSSCACAANKRSVKKISRCNICSEENLCPLSQRLLCEGRTQCHACFQLGLHLNILASASAFEQIMFAKKLIERLALCRLHCHWHLWIIFSGRLWKQRKQIEPLEWSQYCLYWQDTQYCHVIPVSFCQFEGQHLAVVAIHLANVIYFGSTLWFFQLICSFSVFSPTGVCLRYLEGFFFLLKTWFCFCNGWLFSSANSNFWLISHILSVTYASSFLGCNVYRSSFTAIICFPAF